jgi:hypothetical protein
MSQLNWQKRKFDFKPKRALKDEEEFCKTDRAARFIERAEQVRRARRHERRKNVAPRKRQSQADRPNAKSTVVRPDPAGPNERRPWEE